MIYEVKRTLAIVCCFETAYSELTFIYTHTQTDEMDVDKHQQTGWMFYLMLDQYTAYVYLYHI